MNKHKQKLLITGSLGFIASNFIRKFKHEGAPYQFIGIDKVANMDLIPTMYKGKEYAEHFHIGDFADQHFVDVIFAHEKPDVVIHMGASTHVDVSLKDPNIFIHDNVLGTQCIINACLEHKVKKLVYCSTDEIYGSLSSEADPPWTEESPLAPRNPYSASKAAAELLVRAAGNSFNLPFCITRSSNCFGRWQYRDKLLPKVIRCIIRNEPIPIYAKGQNIRDWLFVADNCDGVMMVLEKGVLGETYNITAGNELSNIELVQKVCNIMGKGHDLITFVEDRVGHDFYYKMNADKIRSIGWAPKSKFMEALSETVQWYFANRFWLDAA